MLGPVWGYLFFLNGPVWLHEAYRARLKRGLMSNESYLAIYGNLRKSGGSSHRGVAFSFREANFNDAYSVVHTTNLIVHLLYVLTQSLLTVLLQIFKCGEIEEEL